MARKYVITASIADLRREPIQFPVQDYSHQDLRETQLLFGENIELLDQKEQWLYISAIEQTYFDEQQGWLPHKGWILNSEAKEVEFFSSPKYAICVPCASIQNSLLSFGTLLSEVSSDTPDIRILPKIPNRTVLVEDSLLFLGIPYLWGGRAFDLRSPISSVDCSGLVNLLYRAQGVMLPRNAHDQYLKCRPTSDLKSGDPLYLAKEQRVSHVVLKLDEKTFIEAPKTGQSVRTLIWGKEMWEEKGRIHFFDRESSYIPYPGTFL